MGKKLKYISKLLQWEIFFKLACGTKLYSNVTKRTALQHGPANSTETTYLQEGMQSCVIT